MPNLSLDASRTWFEQAAPGLAHLDQHKVRLVENDQAIEAALVALGCALDRARADPKGPGETMIDAHLLAQILPQLGFCRTVQILSWFAETPAGDAFVKNVIHEEEPRAPLPTLLTLLNRHAVAARIFAPDRVDRLLEVWGSRK